MYVYIYINLEIAKYHPHPIFFYRTKPQNHRRCSPSPSPIVVHFPLHHHQSLSTSPFTIATLSLSPSPFKFALIELRLCEILVSRSKEVHNPGSSIPLDKVLPTGLVVFQWSIYIYLRIVFMMNLTLRSRGSGVVDRLLSDNNNWVCFERLFVLLFDWNLFTYV